jgi:hypothetical protein
MDTQFVSQKKKEIWCYGFLMWKGEYTGCVNESGDFATLFFSGSAKLGRIPVSPFCCQL